MANLPISMPLIQAMGQGSQGYAELPSSYILAQLHRPVILISSGTFADSTGLITGLTALQYVPLGIVQVFVFAGAGIPASGLYWAIFSSTTSCQLYTRFDASVKPSGITPGAYAGGTAEVTLSTITVPADCMGANGSLQLEAWHGHSNTATSKIHRAKWEAGGTAFYASTRTTDLTVGTSKAIRNTNSKQAQVYSSLGLVFDQTGSAGAQGQSAIDTTVVQRILLTAQLAAATDYAMVEGYRLICNPSN